MNLRQLSAFVSVYEEGSFNKAARRLNATQSGLSMQIQNLEISLAVQLFDRSVRGVSPTIAGRRLYARSVDILRSMEDARLEMKTISGTVSGVIRVGLMPTFTRGLLAPALVDFLADFPNVEMQVVEAYSASLTQDVASETLDFAIVPRAANPDGLTAHYLGVDREILVASPSHGLQHLRPADFKALAPLKLAMPAKGNARRDRFEEYASVHGLKIKSLLDLDAMIATLELVAHSDWMTILPATICLNDLDGVHRTLQPIIRPPLTVEYMMIEPAKRALPVAAGIFFEHLEAQFLTGQDRWNEVLGLPSCAPDERTRSHR